MKTHSPKGRFPRRRAWCLLLALLAIACGEEAPATTAPPAPEEEPSAPAESSPEPAVEVPGSGEGEGDDDVAVADGARADAIDPCPLMVLDPRPPLQVRGEPSSDGDALGQLENGTLVRGLERRDGYVRIAEPVAGWVFDGMLMRTCEAPPAFPALPLGPRTYLLFPNSGDDPPPPGTALPSPEMDPDFLRMRFSARDVRPIEAPIPVTLVTARGSCQRSAARRLLLIGSCTEQPDYSTAMDVLEVPSCPELHPSDDAPISISYPMMVGLIGSHEGARLEEWPHTDAPPTPGQRRVIERRIRRIVAEMEPRYRATMTPEMPQNMTRFADSPWSWVFVDEEHLLFRGDRLLGHVDLTSSLPLRVRAGERLLVGVGNAGHHGYGFYMFPNDTRRGLARESGFPTFTCSPN